MTPSTVPQPVTAAGASAAYGKTEREEENG